MAERLKHRGFGSRCRHRSRRGAVLVVALVCVAIATVVFVSIVKMAGTERKATQTEARRLQAVWLAESALQRAAWKLASDDAYSGETWTVAAEQLAGTDAGLVEIEVESIPDEPNRRLVRVQADYPNHAEQRVRRSKQTIVQLP